MTEDVGWCILWYKGVGNGWSLGWDNASLGVVKDWSGFRSKNCVLLAMKPFNSMTSVTHSFSELRC